MDTVEEFYGQLCRSPSDINEHLPTLKKYAEECEHITEMGVRWVVSTYAFANAKPKHFISIDIRHPSEPEWNSVWSSGKRLNDIQNYCSNNNIDYKFILADTTKLEIEQTDLLFIDTLHTYNQLKQELELHGNKATKYLIFHDTTNFRHRNEDDSPEIDGKKGIYPAIEEFLIKNTHWSIHEEYTNCNGLMILKRN